MHLLEMWKNLRCNLRIVVIWLTFWFGKIHNSNHVWLRYYKSFLGLSYLIDDCIFRVFLFWMNVCNLYLPHLLRKWKNVFLGNPLKSFEVHILLSLKYFIITLNDISISWVTHMATSLNLYTNMSRKDWLKHELRRKIKG